IAHAFMAVRVIFDLPRKWAALDRLEGKVSARLHLDLHQRWQDLLIEQTRELLSRQKARSISSLIPRYSRAASMLEAEAEQVLGQRGRQRWSEEFERLVSSGVDEDAARRVASLPVLSRAMAFADNAEETGSTLISAAAAAFAAGEYLRVDELRQRASLLMPKDDYDRQAIEAALTDIEKEAQVLGVSVLAELANEDVLPAWVGKHAPGLAEAKAVIDRVLGQGDLTVARLTIAARATRGAVKAVD
ncbi:MAG: hypothetical protein AB7O43_21925, partial [Hyphomicrobiaceae bacterium]